MEISKFIEEFINILEDTDPSTIKADTIFRNIGEWDSLIALSLIAMVDEQFSVKLSGDDIKTSATINDLFEKVKLKIV